MRKLILLAVLAVGCGAASGSAPVFDGTCVARHGLFRASWTIESGTCGAPPDSVFDADTQTTSGCTGTFLAPDACSGPIDISCTDQSTGDVTLITGSLMWNSMGDGQAHVYVEGHFPDGTLACSGFYTLNYTPFH